MKKLIVIILGFCIVSCSQKLTLVYYNDVSKVDDGEIFGQELQRFFSRNDNIKVVSIKSNSFNKLLKTVGDSIKQYESENYSDDNYYGYAFVTANRDTLFADYHLQNWKYKGKRGKYENNKIKYHIAEATH